jgi:1,4-dihydroxy-2-naphthoate octaprenyltransferase
MSRRSRPRTERRNGSLGWAAVRLARPHFLLGGFLLYGLGAAVARYERIPISGTLYLTGQALVTSLQLMTQFLNEHWDVESDGANRNRTWFSGGSGVLPAGLLGRETAYMLAIFCLIGAVVAAFLLAITSRVTLFTWGIALAAAVCAWFYSTPPLRLASSGYGELVASLVVAVLLPVFGYSLQAGRPSPALLLACAPLFALHMAMLLAFDLPDAEADESAGKRTMLVRLGKERAALLQRVALLAAYALLGVAALAGAPLLVVLSAALPFPLALAQGLTFAWLAKPEGEAGVARPNYNPLTIGGVALFAATAGLMTLGYWRLG